MEVASDKGESEREIPGYVSDLIGMSVSANVIADLYLPKPNPYRADLLEIVDALGRLSSFAHRLWFTVETIEKMQQLTLEHQLHILAVGHQLKDRAAACPEGSDDRRCFANAGKLLRLWYDLSANYDSLRRASEELHICIPPKEKPD